MNSELKEHLHKMYATETKAFKTAIEHTYKETKDKEQWLLERITFLYYAAERQQSQIVANSKAQKSLNRLFCMNFLVIAGYMFVSWFISK